MSVRIANEARTPYFTPKALADYLSISERTVWQLIADGHLASVKIGRTRRISVEEVEAYLARNLEERRR